MKKNERESYIFQKKCLLVLLYVYYLNNVDFANITPRSFGFHFDPTCNFKVIVKSKKENFHKYTINIFENPYRLNYYKVDIMGNVNIIKLSTRDLKESELYLPEAGLNIYFDGENFKIYGYVEGRQMEFSSFSEFNLPEPESLVYSLNDCKRSEGVNSSAESFILWLLRLFNSKLHIDLVMGAGINRDYGAKDWSNLLNTLNTQFYDGNSKMANEVNHYIGQELFTSSMVLKTSGFDIYKCLAKELYEFKEAKSFNDPDSTLYKCVDFVEKNHGTSIITYNYDTNLEYLLKKRGLRYCTIYDENSFVTKDAVCDIYHVHGLLPYGKYDQVKFTDSIIFNESDYYYMYNNPYSWNISKQLHDFKFNCCLFIGISLTDPDMKRLLELGSNYMKFNFIFMKKEKGYLSKVYRDLTAYFFTFDLIPIWINDYSEIGDWLAKI